MAKIQRANQKIFASDAGANQIGQFGSFAAGSVAYTTSPEVIQALAEYDEGWFSAVVANNSPCIEDVNALDYLFSYQLAYQFQSGIPEWDDATNYYIGSFATDGTGGFYVSKANDNLNHVLTDTTYWMPVVVTTPSTGGQVYGPTGSTNAGLTYRYFVPTAASTTPSAVITTPYLEFTSQSVNGAPGLLGNQNGATPDAGLFFIGATKDANTVGDMRFDVRENDNSAFATTTRIAFRWSTFGTTLMTVLRNGALAIGPDGVANQHTLNGEFIRKGTSGTAVRILGGASDSTENYFYLSTAGAKFRLSDNSANVGSIGVGTGSWEWGAQVTGNSNGAQHLSNGYIYGGNVTSTNASGSIGYGANVRYPGANAAETGRTNTTTGGCGVRFSNRTVDNATAIGFYVNQISDATSTAADEVIGVTQGGVITLGISGFAGAHVINGNFTSTRSLSGGTATWSFTNSGTAPSTATFEIVGNRGSAGGSGILQIRDATSGHQVGFSDQYETASLTGMLFRTWNTTGITAGSISGAGGWSFAGNFDVNAGYFRNNSISNTVVVAENLSTNASSTGGTSCFLAIKGTATDSGQTYFSALRNGGGTGSGSIQGNGANSLQFVAASDERLKENIRPMTGAFGKVMAMEPVFYKWKDTHDKTGEVLEEGAESVGWIAQKMEKVFPENVNENEKGIKHIGGWSREHSWIVGAFQEFVGMVKAENKELKETVASLIERITNLESRLSPA